MKNCLVFIVLLSLGCKSTEQSFKTFIEKNYQNESICFRIDKSEKIGTFGTLLFTKKQYEDYSKDTFSSSFESGENCDKVALTGKIGDSIYVGVIYPYKKDISETFSEYQRWFYDAKVYYFQKTKTGVKLDTMSIKHNPPIINPRNNENIDVKN